MSKQGTVCKSQVSATFSALSDVRLVQLCIQHFLQKNLFECFPSSADKPGAGQQGYCWALWTAFMDASLVQVTHMGSGQLKGKGDLYSSVVESKTQNVENKQADLGREIAASQGYSR